MKKKKCIYCRDFGCMKCSPITKSSQMDSLIRIIFYSFIVVVSLLAFDKCFGSEIDVKLKKVIPNNCKIHITSGFRNREHNKKVGGAKRSYHLFDRARDFKTIPRSCRLKIIQNALRTGLTVILYKTHLHIDDRNNQRCLVKIKRGFRYCDSEKYSEKGDL